jgi:ribosomal protein L29
MAVLKMKVVREMSAKERAEKMKELKIELLRSGSAAQKSKIRTKEIKKAIARLLTFANTERKKVLQNK